MIMLYCVLLVVGVGLVRATGSPNPSYLNPIRSSTTYSYTAPNVAYNHHLQYYYLTLIKNNLTIITVYSSRDLAQWANIGYISDNMLNWVSVSSIHLLLKDHMWYALFTGYHKYHRKYCIGYGFSYNPSPTEFSISEKIIYCDGTHVVSNVIVFDYYPKNQAKHQLTILFSLSDDSISEIYAGELVINSPYSLYLQTQTIQVALAVNQLIKWESKKLFPNSIIIHHEYLYLFYTAGDPSMSGLGIGVARSALNKFEFIRNYEFGHNPILKSTTSAQSASSYTNKASNNWYNPNHCSVFAVKDNENVDRFAIIYSADNSYTDSNPLSVIMLDSLLYEYNWFSIYYKVCGNYQTPSTCRHYLFENQV